MISSTPFRCQITAPDQMFDFIRDDFGVGNWFARCWIGTNPPNTACNLELQQELTELAKAVGLSEPYNFARQIPQREKKTRGPRSEKPLVLSGFNPFSSVS